MQKPIKIFVGVTMAALVIGTGFNIWRISTNLMSKHDTKVAQAAYDRGKNVGFELGRCSIVRMLAQHPTDDPALRDRVLAACAKVEAKHAPGTTEIVDIP